MGNGEKMGGEKSICIRKRKSILERGRLRSDRQTARTGQSVPQKKSATEGCDSQEDLGERREIVHREAGEDCTEFPGSLTPARKEGF